jgi:hypothetical protein
MPLAAADDVRHPTERQPKGELFLGIQRSFVEKGDAAAGDVHAQHDKRFRLAMQTG